MNELHQLWGRIYECIGLRQGLSAEGLRFAATLKQAVFSSKPLGEEAAVESIVTDCREDAVRAIEYSQWLLKVTATVDRFLSERPRTQAVVSKIAQARLLAVAFMLRDFPREDEAQLLGNWERTCFRVFGLCRKDARTAIGDYVRLAWSVLNDKPLPDSGTIITRMNRISEGKEHSIDWAVVQLENENCYEGWEEEFRYLLFRYEEYLAKQAGQAVSSPVQ